jgi:Secretion system C-terminal sorting domain
MKFQFSILTIFIVFLLSNTSFATEINPTNEAPATNSKVEIKGSDNEKALLIEFSNKSEEDVTISIMNEEGATVHTDKAKSIKAFSKKFNLASLEKGEYTLKVTLEHCKITQVFEVTKKGIIVKETNRKEVYAPIITEENSKFDIIIPTIKNKYSVLVLNANGDTVFEETQKGLTQLNKRYNMSNLTKGEYLLQVSIDGETYYHNFIK